MGCIFSTNTDDDTDYWSDSDSDSDSSYTHIRIIPSTARPPADFLIVYAIPLALAAAKAPLPPR